MGPFLLLHLPIRLSFRLSFSLLNSLPLSGYLCYTHLALEMETSMYSLFTVA